MASWRTETQMVVDKNDRISNQITMVCNGCGARFEVSKKTIRARATHTCPEKS